MERGEPDGYEARRPVYEAVRLLGVSGYFERTAEFVDGAPEVLATWLDEVLERRLDAIR